MNFFMISKCGEGAGLLKRIQEEGNTVALSILEKDYSSVYDGMINKSNYPDDDAIIIFDSSGNGARADSLRSGGYKVFGGSSFHDKLENDREFGLSFMKENEICVPETRCFKSFSEGISFVKENKKKSYVFKPSGKNLPCKLTYSGCDVKDLILYMNFVEKHFSKEIDEFILQEFIEGAIISTEYWVGKEGFIDCPNHTIEVKKLMNDDLGPSTGCSGNIVWRCDESSLICDLLRGVEEELVKNHYIGPIDINCIVNEEGTFGLEWTPRFGLDAMPTLLQLINGDVGKIIADLASGEDGKMELLDMFAGGARVTIPPYPIDSQERVEKTIQRYFPNEGIPIRGLDDWPGTYFFEIRKEDDLFVHANGSGIIACISDVGLDPRGCFDTPYDILEEAKIPDKQYRTDLGKILTKMYDEVKEVLDAAWS